MSAVLLGRFVDFLVARHAFVVDATLAGVVTGALCATVGALLVVRGESLVGDAVAHATLPGVAAAFLLTGQKSLPVLWLGGLVSSALTMWALAAIRASGRVREDAAIALVTSVAFGVGVLLLSLVQSAPSGAQSGLNTFLFGSAAAVTRPQLLQLVAVGALALLVVVVNWRGIALVSFDDRYARTLGAPVGLFHAALLGATSLIVVASVQAVGVVLVAAMVVVPGTAARPWVRSVAGMAGLAAAIGGAAGWVGAASSYVFDGLPTGPAMVLAASLGLVISLSGASLRRRWAGA